MTEAREFIAGLEDDFDVKISKDNSLFPRHFGSAEVLPRCQKTFARFEAYL